MPYYKVDVSEYTFSRKEGFFVQESAGELVQVNGRHMVSLYGGNVVVGLQGWYGDRDEAYASAVEELKRRIETLHAQIATLQAKQSVEVAA